jgi:hypothetical protein
LVLLIVSVGCGDRAAPEGSVVARWSTFETTLDRPVTEANPFDPAEIAVDVEFVSPSGRSLTVPAFVDREYERELADEREVLRPVGDLAWRVRFTPDEEGVWAWSWRVRTASGEEARSGGRLFVGPPEGARGFVRRVGDGRALRFDDGSPFIAVGENLSWYDSRGTFAYDAWMARLAAEGCTYIRVWMPSWAFGLEWIRRDASGAVVETTLGNYAARLERAWQLDHVLELARQHGIEVMLSIQNHGAFSLAFNSEWADNPYNAVNGGPLVSPRELFTSAEARELFRRRLRYVVGRWGHAPQILAWELWNEVDLVEQPSLPDLLAWHREMAGEIDALDPWDHLISTSTGGVDSLSLLSTSTRSAATLRSTSRRRCRS